MIGGLQISTPPAVSGGPAAAAALEALLAREFPSLPVRRVGALDPGGARVVIDAADWRPPIAGFEPLDVAMAPLSGPGAEVLRIAGEPALARGPTLGILTRWQRIVPRRNEHSATPLFERVLARHRAAHDLKRPLVRADWDHALDTWHWVLRLEPEAGLGVQIAALFHDVERLTAEADRRVEHLASDYQAFKSAHARRGAAMTLEILRGTGLDRSTERQIAELVRQHERPSEDPILALLNDADGLSFFSVNSAGYIDYFGLAHARRKVAYTLARMSPSARARVAGLLLRADIAQIVEEQLGRVWA